MSYELEFSSFCLTVDNWLQITSDFTIFNHIVSIYYLARWVILLSILCQVVPKEQLGIIAALIEVQ